MTELFLDFETRSRADLRRVGAHRYAEDPSTEVVVVAYALDDGLVQRVEPFGGGEFIYVKGAALGEVVYDPTVPVVAHNAEFERLILIHKLGLKGPAAEPSRFRCTAAQAARAGLPRGLEKAAEALGLEGWDKKRKDRVIRKLTQPRRSTGTWWEYADAEEEWEELKADCERDVETCRDLYRLLPPLGAQEQALWELTVRMNDRGLAVDLDSVRRARDLAAELQEEAARRFEELVGAPPASPRARKLLGVESLDKYHVRRYLKNQDLDPRMREALTLRKRWAKSSLAKLDALLLRTSADGRLRGSLTYCGAERTGRWSSHGVQWHNAPKGLGEETDLAFEALRTGVLRAVYDDPLLTISDMLKGFLVGPFLVGDYAQVEARDLAWQAGQKDALAAFADESRDIYCEVASDIYGHRVGKYEKTGDPRDYDPVIHMPKRQLGKVAVLGCGYGLGAVRFREQMDEVFDVEVSPEMAARVVNAYRERNDKVVDLWGELEVGFTHAVSAGPGRAWRVGPVVIGVMERQGRRWAYVRLPSGRCMYYYDPRFEEVGGRGPGPSVTYFGRNRWHGGHWERVPAYGTLLTENVVQATCRDVLAEALLRLDRAGFPLVLQVHDEAVANGAGAERLAEFKRLMEVRPTWAQALPLVVDAYETRRYRK